MPTAALECGADVVLSSTHKISGSLTQSAVLHVGDCGDRKGNMKPESRIDGRKKKKVNCIACIWVRGNGRRSV